MRGAHGLVLIGLLAAVPSWANASAIQPVPAARPTHQRAGVIARQQAEVQRLQKDVTAQESDSRAAAEKLRQQDAEIAELRRQLQAAQRTGKAAGEGS